MYELQLADWWIGNSQEGIVSVFLTTYILSSFTSLGLEHSVCHESLLNSLIFNGNI